MIDEIKVGKDGSMEHKVVYRDGISEYLTCYQGFDKVCRGCWMCGPGSDPLEHSLELL